jgi:hypothetical protein
VPEGQAADIGEWLWQRPRLRNKPMMRKIKTLKFTKTFYLKTNFNLYA